MNHAGMDPTTLPAVIIQKRNDMIVESRLDPNLFIHFAFNTGAISLFIPGKQRFVAIVHVPADADRSLGDEALFARLFSADVIEHAIVMSDDGVRYDVIVGRIMLGSGEVQIEIVPTRLKLN